MRRAIPGLWLAAVACGGQPEGAAVTAAGDDVAQLFAGNHSGLHDRHRLVIADSQTWHAVWDSAQAQVSPAPPLPSVDFSRRRVIVAALGERTSGGFDIRVDSLRDVGGVRTVFVTTTKPGPGCMTIAALTQPVHMVSVPATGGDMHFSEAETTKPCV